MRAKQGDAVRARRIALGFVSAAEAARRSGLSDATWIALESGDARDWRPETLGAFARVLQWPATFMDDIARGDEPVHVGRGPQDETGIRALFHGMADTLSLVELRRILGAWAMLDVSESVRFRPAAPGDGVTSTEG